MRIDGIPNARPQRMRLWAPGEQAWREDARDAFEKVYHLVCWQHGKRYEKVHEDGGRVLEDAGHIVGVLADYLANEGEERAADLLRGLRDHWRNDMDMELPLGGDAPLVEDVMRQDVVDMLEMRTPRKGKES